MDLDENQIYILLPQSMKELAEAIGIENTLVVVNAYANHLLAVPFSNPSRSMVAKLGQKLADRLVAEIPGWHVVVPKCNRLNVYQRNLKMLKLRKDGHTLKELQQRFSMGKRQVTLCLRQAEAAVAATRDRQ